MCSWSQRTGTSKCLSSYFLSFNEAWFNSQPRDPVGFKGCFTPKELFSCLLSFQTVSNETAEGESDARRGSARPVSAHVMTGAFNLLSKKWPLPRKHEAHSSNPVFPRTALRHHAWRSEDSHLSGLFSLRAITAPAPAEERRCVLEKAPGCHPRAQTAGAPLYTPPSLSWRVFCEMKELESS